MFVFGGTRRSAMKYNSGPPTQDQIFVNKQRCTSNQRLLEDGRAEYKIRIEKLNTETDPIFIKQCLIPYLS